MKTDKGEKGQLMTKNYAMILVPALLLLAVGCEDEKQAAKEAALAAATPETPALVENKGPSPEEKKAAEEEAARKAAEDKAEAELAANPLTECCRALGKQAFTLRSPEFHGASKACGEALTAKKDLASVLPEIKKSLKDKALPEECAK